MEQLAGLTAEGTKMNSREVHLDLGDDDPKSTAKEAQKFCGKHALARPARGFKRSLFKKLIDSFAICSKSKKDIQKLTLQSLGECHICLDEMSTSELMNTKTGKHCRHPPSACYTCL
jgi:hypothetical protein